MGKKRTAQSPVPAAPAKGPAEVTAVHTRILRLALAAETSRDYWEHVDPAIPAATRPTVAFEQRWFGSKSPDRVRYLITSFAFRYDAYPAALDTLRRWRSMDLLTRRVLCHWHLQLTDPIYRRFTGEFLLARRSLHEPRVDRAAVLRWVRAEYAGKWSDSTLVQFASKLLSAALEAGLVSQRDPRTLSFPKVTDSALAYLLYLLRETRIEGTLTRNPYLASVGIDEDLLAGRARSLPGVTMRRMMGLVEFEWAYPDLVSWAKETAAKEIVS